MIIINQKVDIRKWKLCKNMLILMKMRIIYSTLTVTDYAGNQYTMQEQKFTVDTINPTIHVS